MRRAVIAEDNLPVVLEHLGSPADTGEDGRARWADAMRETARATGWTCKFSGLGMVLPEITPATVRPWLDAAVDAWGWDRLMFGSNMPMDAMAVGHEALLGAMLGLVGLSPDAHRFFYENARRAYTLPLPGITR